jgi:PHP family Zn ribbon phosphoesterase
MPWYLGNPLNIDLETIEKYTHQLNGLFIPAHIDRPINSIFSQIGFLPDELKVDGMQISKHVKENDVRNKYDIHQDISLIKASDAHYVDDLGSSYTSFYLYEPLFQELRWALNQQNGRSVKIEA